MLQDELLGVEIKAQEQANANALVMLSGYFYTGRLVLS